MFVLGTWMVGLALLLLLLNRGCRKMDSPDAQIQTKLMALLLGSLGVLFQFIDMVRR